MLKKIFILLSFIVNITISCTSISNNTMNNSKYVENIEFNEYFKDISLDDSCFVQFPPNVYVTSINGKDLLFNKRAYDYKNGYMVNSGLSKLTVYYKSGSALSSKMQVQFNFEKDKYYYCNYDLNMSLRNIHFYIIEIIDEKDLERAHSNLILFKEKVYNYLNYISFSIDNPKYLEGTWELNNKNLQLKFLNNKFNIYKTDSDSEYPIIYAGNYYYNKETIVFYHNYNFAKNSDHVDPTKYICYYQLKDEYLEIIHCNFKLEKINGRYLIKKIDTILKDPPRMGTTSISNDYR